MLSFNPVNSTSNVKVEKAPVKSVTVNNSKAAGGSMRFKDAIKILTPGDIFTISDTGHNSYIDEGLYLVSEKDDINEGLMLTRLNSNIEDGMPIERPGCNLVTANDASGDVRIAGSLDITA